MRLFTTTGNCYAALSSDDIIDGTWAFKEHKLGPKMIGLMMSPIKEFEHHGYMYIRCFINGKLFWVPEYAIDEVFYDV